MLGLIRPVHAIAVELPGADAGKMPVPDIAGSLRQRDARNLAAGVEQAQLDLLRMGGEQGEVRSAIVDGRPEACGVPAERRML